MCALYAFLIPIAVLWAIPRNAHGQLYVSPEFRQPGFVSEYETKTGAAINLNFITGLNVPSGLAVKGNTLFVADLGNGTVGKYEAKTGAAINANFIAGLSGPLGLALRGNKLFVTNSGTGTVGEYDAKTGAAINANFITGFQAPTQLVISGIPEPSTYAAIAGALVLAAAVIRRRQLKRYDSAR